MYRPVPRVFDLPAIEKRVLRFWRDQKVFERLREQNRFGPRWSFLDGPITANNPMGVHHAWGRAYKDMFQRYHAMHGKRLRYQNGFDCQGLWVEVEVEKELGFQRKRDILDYGIGAFVNRCKERVLTYAARQTEQSIRLGYWMDWDDPQTLRMLRDALREGRSEVTITTPSGRVVSGSPTQLVATLGAAGRGGSYFTFSNENNFTIWAFLKKCHDEGFLYRGTDVMPWCARCGTGLSQMEVAEGRRITHDTALFVRFPVRGRTRTALLVWTTTPWTLSANVAVAVNPHLTYVEVRHAGWTLYVGHPHLDAPRVQVLEAGGRRETHRLAPVREVLGGEVEVIRALSGSELVGLAYDGPFDHLAAQRCKGGLDPHGTPFGASPTEAHRVLPWDEVDEREGTGLVHIAPGCGTEDAAFGRKHGLPAIAPLDEEGRYVDGFGEWTGRVAGEVAGEVAADLEARGLLAGRERYPHVYPHCWRCEEPLVFRQVEEWFIRMDWRDRIARLVPRIRWIPPDGEMRELDWLKNMGDWMISKKRFWGLALPIWPCQACGQITVIGGEQELRARAVEGWAAYEGHSPHRPWIDEIRIACPRCGARCSRVEDVGNPWLDAGIVPYSTLHYGTDPEYWREWFPADFVVECFPGQFRNWFYALLAMSAMLTGEPPYRVLFGHALVRDARGREMHKSTGNSIAFDEAAEAFGAEVMRYLFASQNPAHDLNFPDLPRAGERRRGGADGEVRRKLLTWWNCYGFFVTYASVDGWKPGVPEVERTDLDRWILSRLQRLITAAERAFEDYAIHRFIDRFEQFIDELSNWYLRRSRERFWGSGMGRDKEAAYQTLYTVLTSLCRLMAPILPFLTEEMYDNLVRSVDPKAPISVHLLSYPKADPALVDEVLEARVDCLLRVKNQVLSLRNAAGIKVRQPLGVAWVRPASPADRSALEDEGIVEQLRDECNVKEVRLIDDESALLEPRVRPDFTVLGPRLGGAVKRVAAALAAADPSELVRTLADHGQVVVDGVALGRDEVVISNETPEHLVGSVVGGTFAALDIRLTPELVREGIARDFNRRVQDRRKALGLAVSDRVTVRFAASERIAEAIEAHRDELMEALLAVGLQRVTELAGAAVVEVAGEELAVEVEPAA